MAIGYCKGTPAKKVAILLEPRKSPSWDPCVSRFVEPSLCTDIRVKGTERIKDRNDIALLETIVPVLAPEGKDGSSFRCTRKRILRLRSFDVAVALGISGCPHDVCKVAGQCTYLSQFRECV